MLLLLRLPQALLLLLGYVFVRVRRHRPAHRHEALQDVPEAPSSITTTDSTSSTEPFQNGFPAHRHAGAKAAEVSLHHTTATYDRWEALLWSNDSKKHTDRGPSVPSLVHTGSHPHLVASINAVQRPADALASASTPPSRRMSRQRGESGMPSAGALTLSATSSSEVASDGGGGDLGRDSRDSRSQATGGQRFSVGNRQLKVVRQQATAANALSRRPDLTVEYVLPQPTSAKTPASTATDVDGMQRPVPQHRDMAVMVDADGTQELAWDDIGLPGNPTITQVTHVAPVKV